MIRQLLLIAALCASCAPSPVHAGTVIGEVFAKTYCSLKDSGVSEADAIAAGVSAATVPGNTWRYVTAGGKTYQSDVVLAVRLSMLLCPQHFPPSQASST